MESRIDNENELRIREALRLSNEESHRLTLECIRSALIYLMGTKPYEKITITEIIVRSGVSRAAFYRNYSSKDAVLQDAMEELRKQLQELFFRSLAGDDPREWVIRFFEKLIENRKDVELLLKANLNQEEIFNKLIAKREYESPMERYKMAMYVSSLWVVARFWFESGLKETPEELADLVLEIFIT